MEINHFNIAEDRVTVLGHRVLLGAESGNRGKGSVAVDTKGQLYFSQDGLYAQKVQINGTEVQQNRIILKGEAEEIGIEIPTAPTLLQSNAFGDICMGQDDNIYIASHNSSKGKYTKISEDGTLIEEIGEQYTSTDTRGYLPSDIYRKRKKRSGIYTRILGTKSYELKDHLGNVRAVISDRRMASLNTDGNLQNHPEIKSIVLYYSFGSVEESYHGSSYTLGFNGMYKDNEWKDDGNSLDFGARMYDSRIGRFLSRDS